MRLKQKQLKHLSLNVSSIIGASLFFFLILHPLLSSLKVALNGGTTTAFQGNNNEQLVKTASPMPLPSQTTSRQLLRPSTVYTRQAGTHAYLKPHYSTQSMDISINQSSSYSSFYHDFIASDLEEWKTIDAAIIEKATTFYDVCSGDLVRFQIYNNSQLWVWPVTQDYNPSKKSPKQAQHKVAFTILGLLHTIKTFSSLPDVDALFHTSQYPCLDRSIGQSRLPIFAQQSNSFHYDIPWPDHSFWSPPQGQQQVTDPHTDQPIIGWANQQQLLSTKYNNVTFASRLPSAYWQGEASGLPGMPAEDSIRSSFADCPSSLISTDDDDADNNDSVNAADEAANEKRRKPIPSPPSSSSSSLLLLEPGHDERYHKPLQNMCDHRYLVSVGGEASTFPLRHAMACRSLILNIEAEQTDSFHTFYSRSLEPGKHYFNIETDRQSICETVTSEIEKLNAVVQKNVDGGYIALSSEDDLTPSLKKKESRFAAVENYATNSINVDNSFFIDDNAISTATNDDDITHRRNVLHSGGSSRKLLSEDGDDNKEANGLGPWTIASNGAQFIQDHLTMKDVLLCSQDLLTQYASRQTFTPHPHTNSICMTGERVLDMFSDDAELRNAVSEMYPWLKSYDGGCGHAQPIIDAEREAAALAALEAQASE
jgi:hypothetical protein